MIQPAFDIGNHNAPDFTDNCHLLIEVSGQCFNYILYQKDPRQLVLLRQYRVYTTGDRTTRDVLEEIISGDQILQQYAHRATVVYNFPASNIIPSDHHSSGLNTDIMHLVNG